MSDAFLMMSSVLEKGAADTILTGGLVGNILLAARGEAIGAGSLAFIAKSGYSGLIDTARDLLARYGEKICLPTDGAWVENGRRAEAPLGSIPPEVSLTDIGAATAKRYQAVSYTHLWSHSPGNPPLGSRRRTLTGPMAG